VAVNDLTESRTLAHLFRHDSVHGTYPGSVEVSDGGIVVDGDDIRVLSERDPAKLPWRELEVDVVVESTGIFRTRELASRHLEAGARKVIISAPASDEDITIVLGVNHDRYDPETHHLISNASCTTNCLAPVAKVLHDNFGIVQGVMTTVHAYTNDQRLADVPHRDLRRSRAATENIIPTSTGAAKAVGKVLPQLAGRLDGMAMRVPVPDGSLVDLVVELEKPAGVEQINRAMRRASRGPMRAVLQFSEEPLVSSDIIGNPHSSVFDAEGTEMLGDRFAKVVAWYDNEWGYSNRVVDLIELLGTMRVVG